jgi:hypothetical protein
MTKERATAIKTCTAHCAGCGEHFHGLTAFDAHRADGECQNPATVSYGAKARKSGQLILQPYSTHGFCDKEPGCWVNGKRVKYSQEVTIWQVAMSDEEREKLRAAFSKDEDEE